MNASPVSASPTAKAKKQALQDHVLAVVKGHRLVGAAMAMGVGKTLIGLRDMARLLPDCQLSGAKTRPFLVAAPTQAILDSWH